MDRAPASHASPFSAVRARAQALLQAAIAIGALVCAAAAGGQAATRDPIRLDLAKPQASSTRKGGARPARATGKQTGRPQDLPAVRLEGTLRVSRDGVVRLGEQLLVMGRQVASLPDANGRVLTPRAWDGREVTVYGTRTAQGVRVALLIDHGQEGASSAASPGDLPKGARPSAVDPQVGELSDAAPR